MFVAEAVRLDTLLKERGPGEISPLLNLGSSTRAYREIVQPWCECLLFAPLRERGVRTIHVDFRDGEGIDQCADMLDEEDVLRLKSLDAKAVLCCNMLEHVRNPEILARHCIDLVGAGGLIYVTVPYSYPHHRDPIDTMYRPAPEELARIFRPARMVKGEILDSGESYRRQVSKRPWILLRHLLRLPFPFIAFESWKRSMRKLYWLIHNYRFTVAVFEVPSSR